jgi:replicative DNA helicase
MSALYNLNAEANLLGILIIENDIFTDIFKLNPEDFYDDKDKIIFANMKSLYSRGQKFDEVVLSTKMPGCDLAEAGGITYLMNLSQSVSTTKPVLSYARIIKDFALKRDIIKNNKLLEKDIESKSVSEISAFLETAASRLGDL